MSKKLSKIATGVSLVSMALCASQAKATTTLDCTTVTCGDSVVWEFNLPATGLNSQNPPYPTIATLTGTNVTGTFMDPRTGQKIDASGVFFDLATNSIIGGAWAPNSFVERLQFVYQGPELVDEKSWDSDTGMIVNKSDGFIDNYFELGALESGVGEVRATSAEYGGEVMDSSYKSNSGQHITIDWKGAQCILEGAGDSGNCSADFLLAGLDVNSLALNNFTSTEAEANNKPSPIFGIISTTGLSLDGENPTPSNWVAGQVPIPAAAWLFGSALLGLAGIGRKRASIAN